MEGCTQTRVDRHNDRIHPQHQCIREKAHRGMHLCICGKEF